MDFIRICIRKWRWFAVSVATMLVLGILFLLVMPPRYERTATIMVKDESGSGGLLSSMVANMGMLAGMAGLNIASNVNNEMEILASPALMMQVVDRLALDTRYEHYDGIKKLELWDETLPVKMTFPQLSDKDGAYLKMDLRRDGTFTLYKFRKNKDKLDGKIEGKVNSVVDTPIGKLSVIKTKHFDKCFTEENEMTIRITKERKYDQVERCEKKLEIDLADDQTSIVSLTYYDQLSDRAELLLNTLIEVYQEEWMKDKLDMAQASTRFIDERIVAIEQQLGGLDKDIAQFRGKNLMPDYEATAKMLMENAALTYEEQVKVNNQLYMMEQMRNQILKEEGTNQVLPANLLPDNENVALQISEFNKLQLQRNSMAENSSEKNPLVQDLDQQLASMRRAIVSSLDQGVAQLRALQKGVGKEDQKLKQQISTAPETVIKVLPAERQHKIIEALYIYLLEKREENNIAQVYNAKNLRIVSPPLGKLKPVFPKKGTTLIVAFLLGLILPALTLYLRSSVRRILNDD